MVASNKALSPADVSVADNDIRYVPTSGKSFCGIAHESRYNWLLDGFDLRDKVVLDFGCGSGYGVAIISQKAKVVYGIDYSPQAILYAKSKYASGNVKYFIADACSQEAVLAIMDRGSIDIICSFDVIEHLERYFNYLENARSLLKPDGVLVIGCPNRLQLFKWTRDWNPYHFQEFSPYQLRSVLELYFNDVLLVAQDFHDPLKREAIRTAQYATSTLGRLVEVVPKFLVNVLRKLKLPYNILMRLLRPATRTIDCRVSDIEFKMNPRDEALSEAFGLIAVCRSPKGQTNEEQKMD